MRWTQLDDVSIKHPIPKAAGHLTAVGRELLFVLNMSGRFRYLNWSPTGEGPVYVDERSTEIRPAERPVAVPRNNPADTSE